MEQNGTTGEQVQTYIGVCSSDKCGPEAACVPLEKNTYKCVCPHNYSQPSEDFKCNRLIVPATPSSKILINVIPPTGTKNESHVKTTLSTTEQIPSGYITPIIFGAMGISFLIFFALLCACCYRWPRSNRFHRKPRPRRNPGGAFHLPKGFLEDDKFTTNPQYTVSLPELQAPNVVHLPQLPRDAIRFENVIGEGCFGKVYKGKLIIQDDEDQTVAMKLLKESATPEAEEDFMREVEIMASFQHPNILSLLGFVAKDLGKSPCMVFEFMPYGDLTDVLPGNSKTLWKSDPGFPRLSKDSLLSISIQIARGMQYLAEQHFVHRDLACRNCLVGENLTVKIADFGMSRDVYTCDYYRIGGSRLMPVRWMSPESISYGRFTLESDVWSYGVVLWEIYTLGMQPHFGHSNEKVVERILHGVRLVPPDDCPSAISEIMNNCWEMEPKDRTNFTKIHERLVRMFNLEISSNLPRPPPFMVTTSILEIPETEVEYYLKPQPASPPHEYIQPLPD
uniref:Tyrosine-protein kinase receptor n=1 Tax=Lygus hesperus TaxID=30085 RepID=A0A0K8ST81_LYGHE